MGVFDKVRGLLKGREQRVKQAVDKVGNLVDTRTKGKYHEKIEKAEQKAGELVDKAAGTAPAAAASEPDATPTPEAAKPTVPAEPTPAEPSVAAERAAGDVLPADATPDTTPAGGPTGAEKAAEPFEPTLEEPPPAVDARPATSSRPARTVPPSRPDHPISRPRHGGAGCVDPRRTRPAASRRLNHGTVREAVHKRRPAPGHQRGHRCGSRLQRGGAPMTQRARTSRLAATKQDRP